MLFSIRGLIFSYDMNRRLSEAVLLSYTSLLGSLQNMHGEEIRVIGVHDNNGCILQISISAHLKLRFYLLER